MKNKEKPRTNRLLLIDSSALIYRAFYALPPLTDKEGRVVNAVYGFTSAFLNILEKFKPTHIVFAFDAPRPTFRDKKYSQYKAKRAKAPEDLYAQIPISKEMVKAFKFPGLEENGFEADDIIGTVSQQYIKSYPKGEVIIATADQDTLQLVDDKIKVYSLSRGVRQGVIYDKKEVVKKYGIKPSQMIDFKGLFGDPSDNIPGVKGIGKKTAEDLLKEFQSIEDIYRNIEKVKPAVQKKLKEDKKNALLSKELATLHLTVPVKINWDESQFSKNKLLKGAEFLEGLAFNSLAIRIQKSNGKVKEIEEIQTNIEVEEFKKGINPFSKYSRFVFWSGESEKGKGLVVGVINDNNMIVKAYFIKPKLIKEAVKGKVKGYGFGLKKTIKDLFPDLDVFPISDDLKLKAYLLQPQNLRSFNFKEAAWYFVNKRWEEPKAQLGFFTKGIDFKQISQYLEILAEMIDPIEKEFSNIDQKKSSFLTEVFPHIKKKNRSLNKVNVSIEKPITKVLAYMEMAGIKIDTKLLKNLGDINQKKIDKLKKEIFSLSKENFNLDSPSQLSKILYEKLQIPTEGKRGKAGHYSTSAPILEQIQQNHSIIPLILNYREQRKFQTTYLEVIPKLVDKDNRLHTSFNQTVTTTGRLSSSDPNLQNIPLQPIDEKNKIGIRHAFIAEKGYRLIAIDYSQIEIRIAAYLTQEKKLIKAFENGRDIHQETASLVYNIPLDKVDSNLRRMAKSLNFGVVYGMSSYGFSKSAGVAQTEAKEFIDNYFNEFKNIAGYSKKVKEFAHQHGYVETIYGRRRYLPEINSRNRMLSQGAERMAINMPFQGTAADIMKKALIGVNEFIEKKYRSNVHPLESPVRILLSIHDEIVLEVKDSLVNKVAGEVTKIMENTASEILPLKVDVGISQNWGEAK